MILGQYFFVFGTIPLINAKGIEKLICIPPLTIGILGIVIPYMMLHPKIFPFNIIWTSFLPLIFIFMFVLAGLGMIIIFSLLEKKYKKNMQYNSYSNYSRT